MANVKIGSKAGWNGNYAENLDSDRTLTLGDSGKIFFMDLTGSAKIDLPKLSTDMAGWNAVFIVQTTGSGVFSFLAYGLPIGGGNIATYPDSDADKVCFVERPGSAEEGGRGAEVDGLTLLADANEGDTIRVECSGTKWYLEASEDDKDNVAGIDS